MAKCSIVAKVELPVIRIREPGSALFSPFGLNDCLALNKQYIRSSIVGFNIWRTLCEKSLAMPVAQ